jgi:hypothetical protein
MNRSLSSKRAAAILCISLFVVTQGYGEDILSKAKIQFDVMFWKKELRINKAQEQKIRYINKDLYASLYDLSAHRTTGEHQIETVVDTWKASIMDVLTVKQKRKWEKIQERY